ncbi:MAG: xanthine dehydrogenase family protein molybdopterin-binding subunit [Rhodospirillales bacterium]|nr:xanthine dehydrogenase family protein molybdopterin-binding subunit [Rhodospirillales bacterium]
MSDNSTLSELDRPNSYIGRSVPRPNIRRLLEGRGTYTDDIVLPRMAHVAFHRSPHAHAMIKSINSEAAAQVPGVIRIVTGRELAEVMTPWVGVLSHLAGMKSAPQHAIAVNQVCWQGEAVAAVVAENRAVAEDGVELIEVEYDELPVVADMETALDEGTHVIHPELGDNLIFQRELDVGDVDAAFAEADEVVEETYRFGRHTGVTTEPRIIIADYEPAEDNLTVYLSSQAPHMMKNLYAKHLDMEEDKVRVICKDVGGSFGIKVHTYADEMATVALSKLLKRPVKFLADRLESFVTDIHARDHRVKIRLGIKKDGTITGMEFDDLTGVGPYSMYPRTSGIEANQVVVLTGGPYTFKNYRAKATVVALNLNLMCQYRAVGHPIACAIAEGIVDDAARAIGMDPAEVRRKNLIPDDAYPYIANSGLTYEKLSHHQCLDKLLEMMDYDGLRQEQAELREKGVYRGIGLASMIEVTNPSPMFYGAGGAFISAQDGVTVRMDHNGGVTASTSITEQGQGADAITAQIVASSVGVDIEKVRVVSGDTEVTPYGGGTWASRATGIGGEAALRAGKQLRQNIKVIAGAMLQAEPDTLDVQGGTVVDIDTGKERLALSEVGRVVYFRGDTLPKDLQPELVVSRHYVPKEFPFTFTNGIQAFHVEVDTDTGFVKLLKCWVVEDCGTVINPQLVDGQIRGGVIQGVGGAMLEHCIYDDNGQLQNANMADYMVPMAVEMPDIEIAHCSSPTKDSELGAKGAGEAGTCGAPGAVMNAINDALSPLSAKVNNMPFTPEKVLKALGKV